MATHAPEVPTTAPAPRHAPGPSEPSTQPTTTEPSLQDSPTKPSLQVRNAAQVLSQSSNAVFFGGAGVSTESGIPDFRSEAGLYHAEHTYGHSPEDLLSVTFAGENPELFFTYYKENLVHLSARPNPAHQALANWESNGPLSAVITQNIDGLHQAAGSRTVHELHGSIWRQYCTRCHERYTLEWTLNPTNCREPNHVVPQCPACGSMVRPDVTLYGEALPEGVMEASAQAIAAADTMIVGGTSLAVYPAAGLVDFFRGSTLILINTSPTPLDHRADIVITQPIGRAMEDIRSLLDE